MMRGLGDQYGYLGLQMPQAEQIAPHSETTPITRPDVDHGVEYVLSEADWQQGRARVQFFGWIGIGMLAGAAFLTWRYR